MTEKLKYTVLDLETSVKNTVGGNKASPHCPDNKIVLAGVKTQDRDITTSKQLADTADWEPGRIMVGTNIPFDLKYLYRELKDLYNHRGNIRVWDCQIAEYLLTRQRHKYPSLDAMSKKYGGTVKDDEIKKHWDAGGQTEDIDPAKLEAYLREDVKNTELVFKAQLKEAVERKMLPLVVAQMDSVMAITEMEYNGITVDKPFVEQKLTELSVALVKSNEWFINYVISNTDVSREHVSLDSPKSLSTILYGGKIPTKEKKAVGFYKNGNVKYLQVKGYKDCKGFGIDPASFGIEKTVHGFSTDEKALKKLVHNPAARAIDMHRGLQKDFGTYFNPVNNLIFPDGRIHQNLNQTSTDTGRLSCTEPNLQNQTDKRKSEIKKAFISRWGENGVLVEVDYKQLEIVALAQLSGDPSLIKDCNDGVDIHTELFRNMYGRVPNDWERKQFKRLSFALIYGSGINNMAQQAGVSVDVARNFKRTFESKYPGVPEYRRKVRDEVMKNRVPTGHGHDLESKLPLASSYYRLPTGRELYYREFVQKNYMGGKSADFSYTQLCNYPVQSFATGDLVPIMLGKLWKYLVTSIYKDKALLINTVHDSILLDIHKDILQEVLPNIKEVLEDVPRVMKTLFNLDMTVSPKVTISAGPNWFEQSEVKL